MGKKRHEERLTGFKTLAAHDAAVGKDGEIDIQKFDGRDIRRVIHNGRAFYSVVDVVGVLTESEDPRNYWKVTKKRLLDEGAHEAVTDCNQLKLRASDGKLRATDCADIKTLLRIVQSVPSKKAEP